MSNVGHWNTYYEGALTPAPYGDLKTYQLGIQFLTGCDPIEDWGCGLGWFRHMAKDHGLNVRNVDGSYSPFADAIKDLEHYRPEGVEGIYIRHVLEHNTEWEKILRNALDSATKRVAVVIFTPMSMGQDTKQLAWVEGYDVPDLSLPLGRITALFRAAGFNYLDVSRYTTGTYYGQETTIFGSKERPLPDNLRSDLLDWR